MKFHIYDEKGTPSIETYTIEELQRLGISQNTFVCPVMGKPAPFGTFANVQNTEKQSLSLFDWFSICALCVAAFFLYKIVTTSQERQEIVVDKSEIGNVKYGLFNIYEWRTKVSLILDKKIDEFELTEENQGELQQKIEEMLYWLLDEVNRIMYERANEGFFGALQAFLGGFVLDINDLKSRVPEFAQRAMSELGNDATMDDIKIFIKSKIRDYLQRTFGEEDKTEFQKLLKKYNCQSGGTECITELEDRKTKIDSSLWKTSLLLLFCVFAVFALFYLNSKKTIYSVYILLTSCLLLLSAGLLTPMIDLDARINQIDFTLMGEPISFSEQFLFFQSKSILDVVTVLVKSGRIDSIIVGSLIFLFSVLFPLCKLFSCASVIQNPKKLENRITNFLVLKSGKWSMADVIVVAIIMAYIGFQGIINNQLSKIQLFSSNIEVLTTNNTELQIGFILFTTFCVLGILFSSLLEKYINKTEYKL